MSFTLVRKVFSHFSRHGVPVETARTDGGVLIGDVPETSADEDADESP